MTKRRKHNRNSRIVLIILALVLVVGVVWAVHKKFASDQNKAPVTIVLSAYFGDGIASLGGFLNKAGQSKILATFFTGIPAQSVVTQEDAAVGFSSSALAMEARARENALATSSLGVASKEYSYLSTAYAGAESNAQLESDITEDIQALVASQSGRPVSVYGPSSFPAGIAGADAEILTKAFIDVAESYPNQNVHFYFYENYPAVVGFNKTSVISLQKYLENNTDFSIQQVQIQLTAGNVSKKTNALSDYTSFAKLYSGQGIDITKNDADYTNNRCMGNACEVVYEIMQ